jgi:hypothetical protein
MFLKASTLLSFIAYDKDIKKINGCDSGTLCIVVFPVLVNAGKSEENKLIYLKIEMSIV